MNDPILVAKKLASLVDLARLADSEFEKATVFAATESLVRKFQDEEDQFDAYALEQVSKIRWCVAAALGYDIDNGHPKDHHIVSALGAASTLLDVLKRTPNFN